MSYEQHCIDFALYGCPMREHYDHELMAEYDRWDGHRGEGDADFEAHMYQCELEQEAEDKAEFDSACNEDIADYLETL